MTAFVSEAADDSLKIIRLEKLHLSNQFNTALRHVTIKLRNAEPQQREARSYQVVVGGALVSVAGILIGSS